jgi:serine/threonine protein kinase/tetratricopeptide (TPR) repeat protein
MEPDAIALSRELATCSLTEREDYYVQHEVPAALRVEVESLLRFDSDTEHPADGRAADVASVDVDNAATAAEAPDAQPSLVFGPYRLLQRLGEGGMGEVWLAEQTAPVRRKVAVKVIKAGMDTRHVVARFETERQALAVMDHPAIAKVFDAGVSPQGRPYFVMEYARGEAITAYCNRHHLTTRDRLDLFLQVCDGVQHAHQKGIIHRDLKPSNILVTLLDNRPVPKIIDFGVAKATAHQLTDRSLFTEIGMLIGTPEYMSPEQAEMTGVDIDTRSDVYALGAILYELLTGFVPLDGKLLREKGVDEIRRTIREVDPVRPSMRARTSIASAPAARNARPDVSGRARELQGDLDWITMRALEKDRARRYGSVAELAADIRRHLNDVPVVASPPSTVYRMRKFWRRHRVGVSVAATLVAVLIAFAATTAVQAGRIARERDRANREAEIARAVNDFLQNDLLATAGAGRQARPGSKPDPDLKVRTAVDRAAARVQDRFATQPLVEASIRSTIGATYYELGLYAEAERQAARALELRRQGLGEEHVDTLKAMANLTEIYGMQGKFAQAEPLTTKALEIQRRVLGEEHPETLVSMDNLGSIYRRQGKYAEAETLFTKTLDARRRISGDEDPQTLLTTGYLAELYERQGKYALAEQLAGKVLEVQQRILGEEHPETLLSMNRLAVMYFRESQYARAAEIFSRVLDVQRRILGEEHPDTLTTMSNLSSMYANLGDYDRAAPLRIKSLEIQRRVLGENNPNTLTMVDNLGALYRAQGKYSEAELVFINNLEARRGLLGAEHPDVLSTMSNLAVTYFRQGNHPRAEPIALELLEIRRRVLGAQNPGTTEALVLVGLIQFDLQKYADAERAIREALNGYEKAGTDDWRPHRARALLGATLAGQRKYADAEPLLLSGHEGMSSRRATIQFENRSALDRSGSWIVQLYRDWGRPDKAAEWAEKLPKLPS